MDWKKKKKTNMDLLSHPCFNPQKLTIYKLAKVLCYFSHHFTIFRQKTLGLKSLADEKESKSEYFVDFFFFYSFSLYFRNIKMKLMKVYFLQDTLLSALHI